MEAASQLSAQESKENKGVVAIVERFAESPAADNATPKCGHNRVKALAKDIKEKMEQEINSKQHDSVPNNRIGLS